MVIGYRAVHYLHIWILHSQGGRFKGAIGILVSQKLTLHIMDSRIITEAQAQFVILDIHGQRIGIFNIYVNNKLA
jgi:hypothetical protein